MVNIVSALNFGNSDWAFNKYFVPKKFISEKKKSFLAESEKIPA